MSDDKRLFIPPQIGEAKGAYELLSAWVYDGKIGSMSRTCTPLDKMPHVWGQVLVALAHNIASSAEEDGIDRAEMLRAIKRSIDAEWDAVTRPPGQYHPPGTKP